LVFDEISKHIELCSSPQSRHIRISAFSEIDKSALRNMLRTCMKCTRGTDLEARPESLAQRDPDLTIRR
jgi:hypothetical protein